MLSLIVITRLLRYLLVPFQYSYPLLISNWCLKHKWYLKLLFKGGFKYLSLKVLSFTSGVTVLCFSKSFRPPYSRALNSKYTFHDCFQLCKFACYFVCTLCIHIVEYPLSTSVQRYSGLLTSYHSLGWSAAHLYESYTLLTSLHQESKRHDAVFQIHRHTWDEILTYAALWNLV